MMIEETHKMDTESPEVFCVISGLRCVVNEIFFLLECYTAYIASYRHFVTTHHPIFNGQTIQKDQAVQKIDCFTLEYGTDCPETSVSDHQSTLRNITEERRSQAFYDPQKNSRRAPQVARQSRCSSHGPTEKVTRILSVESCTAVCDAISRQK
jgi:hypothetical protein